MVKIIANLTGGRLANQLYFVLHAYVQSKRLNIECRYRVIDSTWMPKFDIDDVAGILNIQKYIDVESKIVNELMPINYYYQEFDKDFKEEELNGFIDETLLLSTLLKIKLQSNSYKDNSVAIHIRNGDYLKYFMYQCFNKLKYLLDSFNNIDSNIDIAIIYSDDNNKSKELFDSILNDRFETVIYKPSDESSPLNDFFELSTYKNKILWNSTFSYWTGFIADRIYDKLNKVICPKLCWNNELAVTRGLKYWLYL